MGLGSAMLAYLLGIVLVITLAPFRFAVPQHFWVTLTGPPLDVVANVALFVPLGFLYRLSRPGTALRVFGLGMVPSAGIECAQMFEVERYPSLLDVLANGGGAWLGAVLHRHLTRRIQIDAGTVGRFALELPLMGLIYLLVPLLWLDSAAVGGEPARLLSPLLLGLFGASLLASMQRHHFGPAGLLSSRGMARMAVVWFGVGLLPALLLLGVPLMLVAFGAALLFFFVVWHASQPVPVGGDRRFELRALRAAAGFYVGYLLLIALLPLHAEAVRGFQLGLAADAGQMSKTEIIRLLEATMAFTALGYMLAEVRGRLEQSFRHAAGWVLLVSALAAGMTELLRGWGPAADGASALRFILALAAGSYGGWLYHLQRDQIRELLTAEAEYRHQAIQ